MSEPSSTPLSRYGSRVPTLSPKKPAVTAAAPAAETTTAPATAAAAPTIRTLIVCLPPDLPHDAVAWGRLDRHLGVPGTLTALFWATPALRPWQRRHLFDLRPGRPVACAGGPVRLLDLAGLRHAAGLAAAVRHHLWQQVIRGTRPATPWPVYRKRHLADPAKYSLRAAQADYGRQPRVLAVRLHNAANPGSPLDPAELEIVQAGAAAYAHHGALTAVAGDALLTTAGTRLAPDTDSATDRITYLDAAHRHLAALDRQQRLLAVAL